MSKTSVALDGMHRASFEDNIGEGTMATKRGFLLALAASVSTSAICPAFAEAYPARPIIMVVPFPVGGPTDTVGRILAERMGASLGKALTIENVAGADGTIGVGRVARALPDGYTIGLGIWSTHVVNGAIYKLQYDVVNDFEPIALLANTPLLIIAKTDVPANDLMGLIAWLKANPGKASLGTGGMGSPQHIAGILFQQLTNTRFQFVHYRGAAPLMQDLVAGHIDINIDAPAISLPQVRAGSIKAYAVTARSRLPSAPDVPTVDQAGLPGFYLTAWLAFFAPKGTPKPIIDKLNATTVDALAALEVRTRFADLGLELFPREQQTPEALAAVQKADIEKWWPIIKRGL
jgi:tripartite-type tricarboxylate transporter receptor subunit TctC